VVPEPSGLPPQGAGLVVERQVEQLEAHLSPSPPAPHVPLAWVPLGPLQVQLPAGTQH